MYQILFKILKSVYTLASEAKCLLFLQKVPSYMFNMVFTLPLMRCGSFEWRLVGTKAITMFAHYEIPSLGHS